DRGVCDEDRPDRQPRAAGARGGPPALARPVPARCPRPDWNTCRVRNRTVRRVHRDARRCRGEILHGARRASRWLLGANHRGAGARRQARSGPASVLGATCSPVRILHAGDDHRGARPARSQSSSDRGGDPPCGGGQLVRLHRLSAHRRGGPAGSLHGVGGCRAGEGAMSTAREPYVGRRIKRTEDPRLIRGLGQYVDDLRFADLCFVCILRSPHAHARVNSLDVSKARSARGVVSVATVEDLDRAQVGDVPCGAVLAGMKKPDHRPLAQRKVRFVGEPVAAVVASSAAAARDAVELIEVDYEPLPAVVDPEAALQPGAPLIHEELGTNKAFDWSVTSGDVEAAFRSAARVISQRMIHQRLIPCSMEPRGAVAQYSPGDRQLTLYTSTQIPHLVRSMLAGTVGLPENHVRVVAPEVGGGFGSKLNFYAEEILLAYLAMQVAPKPVKWIESRRENFAATIHGRGQVGTIEGAVTADGRILGVRYRSVQDLGAYPQLLGPAIPTLTGLMAPGCYKMDSILVEVTGVYTNQMSTDAYRGAGRPEATYQIERLMDIVADELGVDPVELRRRNMPQPEEFPFKTATGLTYDSGNYQRALDRALQIAGMPKLREEQRR